MNKANYAVLILNLLMRNGEMTTNEIIERTGCTRKTVYKAMDILETSGFGIEIEQGKSYRPSRYKFSGVYEFSEVG